MRPIRTLALPLFLSAVLAAPAFAAAPPAAPRATPGAESNLLLFEVRLGDQVLSDAVTAYQIGKDIYLPLGEMARLLTLAVRVTPGEGKASGYILQEERAFSLDVPAREVHIAGKLEELDRSQIKLQADEIYVASRLLARWLPVDLGVDMPSLTIKVRPREQLPLQARLQRRERGAQSGRSGGYIDPGYPRLAIPYRLVDVPFIDQTASVSVARSGAHREAESTYTGYLTTDLLGMEAALYASYNKRDPTSGLRLTLGRNDPGAGLLGPLHARSALAGSVPVQGVANISANSPTGNGLALSNRPLDQPTRFDSHSLQGDLPPGWDVELYYNDALVGFQQSRPDGKYSFDDQPMVYGPNEFRLVFHGPLGQLRVERQSFLLEQSAVPPGAVYYDVAAHRDVFGRARALAQMEWGVGEHLSASAGLLRLPVLQDEQKYATLGLRGYLQSFILSGDVAQAGDGGKLAQLGLKTRIGNVSLSASRARLDNFTSEFFLPTFDPVRLRDELRADGMLVGSLGKDIPMVFPLSLQLRREALASGLENREVQGRMSAYGAGLAVSNALRWQSLSGRSLADGQLQVSRRVAGIGLSGQLQYLIKPHAELGSLALAADRYFADGYVGNLGLVHTFGKGPNRLTASLNKSLGSYGLGLNAFYGNSHEYGAGVQLFMAMGLEPRAARFLTDAQPMANTGGASVRVFLDKNQNGTMDAEDEGIRNAGFTVNGGNHLSRTDANGIAWLGRLPANQYVDIALDPNTLEDPQWQPQRKGVRIVPRPGKVAEIDFAVGMTGEIDGTTYLLGKDGKRPIGDLKLELVDRRRQVVASLTSAADGYYVITGIFPGDYLLRITPDQLKRLGLSDTGMHLVTITLDGNVLNGRDFYVQAGE
ncbi:hypothetical protein SRABI118_00154 [Massilia sp. Bi118]|uniref:carboxypeptidase-like regulatory domain-containing protein n=1 Tax=Massilia sp. Bi118 TaxID=2822346 RepID=UPI001DF77060|nr:carboxypeptidase-like regulatory domain-containing protein [Massilia sp. Bi118]CAH0135850.1 hypothetical protein SRABI118_00154 [Massilia sp. Bi118]